MSYDQIEITEVGPPEYPLLRVLRDTIFAELLPSERCPAWFSPEDYEQLKLIRDHWI